MSHALTASPPQQVSMQQLGANLRFVLRELRRRAIDIEIVDAVEGWVVARLGAHVERLVDIDGSPTRYTDALFASNKHVAKRLLSEAGLSVPHGARFDSTQIDEALLFAQQLGGPAVVKPCVGTHGIGVSTHLELLVEVKDAIERVHRTCGATATFVVEEHFQADEYRVFITRRGAFAAVHRDPAHVVGDGLSTVRRLAFVETDRRTYPRRLTAEGPIAFDDVAVGFLEKQGISPEDVLPAGHKVYLRGNSNLKTGGTCRDVTDIVHDSVLQLAQKALDAFPGVAVLGIDLMSIDVASEQLPDAYRVIEVNTCPGIGMHMTPGAGAARDTAGAIADVLFPETAGPVLPLSRLPPCPPLVLESADASGVVSR